MPELAHDEYRYDLVDSRKGVNLTLKEATDLGNKIKPFIKQGLSISQILVLLPELNISEKTFYNYIDIGIFDCVDIKNIDLRRKVSRKLSKKETVTFKKRNDYKHLNGRKYDDYLNFIKDNPNCNIWQMDTVYNNISNGPFIQTLLFLKTGLLIAVYHKEKTSNSMIKGINMIYETFGKDIFIKYFNVIITDRGVEFSSPDLFETDCNKIKRTNLFYCDPMQSNQKAQIENKHIMVRYILPKETNLYNLGLTGQDSLNLVSSHINSAPLSNLNGKCPFDLSMFFFPDLIEKLVQFGIRRIDNKDITLKPYLLKQYK